MSTQHLNLFSADLRRQRPWATLQHGVVLLALLALLCLAAVPLLAWLDRQEREAMTALQASLAQQREQTQQRLAGGDGQGDPTGPAHDTGHALRERWQQLKREEAARQQVRQVIAGGQAGRGTGHAALLLALARQADPAVWLTGVTVAPDGQAIELTGRMADPAALPGYLERLRREPLLQGRAFAQLQLRRLDAEGAEPEAAGLTEFLLRSTLLPIATGSAGLPQPVARP
ncbi:PilN domain-containing protein [Leptothrix discophora]|uniref:PilN domain-containing protein n=1 Tax=Leptothrix discophora TaxID=89 RepID=A0ABT9G7Z1_LEPDI|nr:PilN domain-containing protein [Leptothrix discophora]MDP4302601.1 PilN domain-containing protein [Leptothrix discophora]